jgi:hypothetical protein
MKLSDEIERIGIDIIAKKTGILETDLKNKILANNFTVEDVYRFRNGLNLENEKTCELFGI